MIYLRKYNEGFDPDDYLDYLLSEVDESKIYFKDINENFIFLNYDITLSEIKKLKRYLKNPRFSDVVVLTEYQENENDIYDGKELEDTFIIFIINKDFYNNNEKYLYKNIKWDIHPLRKEFMKSSDIIDFLDENDLDTLDNIFSVYKRAEKAIGLPDHVSMIRNLVIPGEVEIWNRKDEQDPIRIDENDTVTLQYYLFKYLGQ